MIPIEESLLKQIDKVFFGILWSNKLVKIKRSTIIAPIDQGRLGMIDFYEVHATAKCRWFCLFDNAETKWNGYLPKPTNHLQTYAK